MQYVTGTSTERRILAWTAHELRNTLTPLASAMDILSNEDADRRAWALAIAQRQLRCMRRLVSEMTQAAVRADYPAERIVCERLALQEVVEDSVADFEPMFAARGQHISSVLEPGTLWVHADPTRLKQVFSNLIANASKYTPRGGHVSVSCAAARGRGGEVAIQDDGVGILPENLQRIFEPCYREDRARTIAPGWGVGLCVASTLVQAHGGCIRAESRGPGTGARFVVRLPLLKAAP